MGTAAIAVASSLSNNYGGQVSCVLKERMKGQRDPNMRQIERNKSKSQPKYDEEEADSDRDEGREAREDFLDFIHKNSSSTVIPLWQQEVGASKTRMEAWGCRLQAEALAPFPCR